MELFDDIRDERDMDHEDTKVQIEIDMYLLK